MPLQTVVQSEPGGLPTMLAHDSEPGSGTSASQSQS
jgi:hypothetical protein